MYIHVDLSNIIYNTIIYIMVILLTLISLHDGYVTCFNIGLHDRYFTNYNVGLYHRSLDLFNLHVHGTPMVIIIA